MEGVQLKRKRQAQPLRGREPGARNLPLTPCPLTVTSHENEDAVISVQHQIPYKQMTIEGNSMAEGRLDAAGASLVRMLSEDNSTIVVDMDVAKTQLPMENLVANGHEERVLWQDGNINWRKHFVVMEDLTDLQVAGFYYETTEKQGGCIIDGGKEEMMQLLKESPSEREKGVICNSQVLCSDSGRYDKGKQYEVNPNTISKGAYGEAAMCQDIRTGKTFIRKKVHKVSNNEVVVPLMLKGIFGITEVYGVIRKGQTTEIFQEFAGLSLEKLCYMNSEYARRLRDPSILLALAFQGFKTLQEMHSHGVQHLDLKPENICVELGQKGQPHLKLIDFGTSQMPGEVVTDGFTFEYLSPESCRTLIKLLQMNSVKQQRGGQQEVTDRLEDGADVWAMALSLLYFLYGYHLMVYACTGDFNYRATQQQKVTEQRLQCLLKILKMTDDDMARLIHPALPDVLKVLFTNTLRVNPEHRWSAGTAATFILQHLAPKPAAAEPPALDSGSVAGSSVIRLRAHTAQNLRESHLSPWITQTLSPSHPTCGSPMPHWL